VTARRDPDDADRDSRQRVVGRVDVDRADDRALALRIDPRHGEIVWRGGRLLLGIVARARDQVCEASGHEQHHERDDERLPRDRRLRIVALRPTACGRASRAAAVAFLCPSPLPHS
jgi:hypothetical protein